MCYTKLVFFLKCEGPLFGQRIIIACDKGWRRLLMPVADGEVYPEQITIYAS